MRHRHSAEQLVQVMMMIRLTVPLLFTFGEGKIYAPDHETSSALLIDI
jgi:hypothetical protein